MTNPDSAVLLRQAMFVPRSSRLDDLSALARTTYCRRWLVLASWPRCFSGRIRVSSFEIRRMYANTSSVNLCANVFSDSQGSILVETSRRIKAPTRSKPKHDPRGKLFERTLHFDHWNKMKLDMVPSVTNAKNKKIEFRVVVSWRLHIVLNFRSCTWTLLVRQKILIYHRWHDVITDHPF